MAHHAVSTGHNYPLSTAQLFKSIILYNASSYPAILYALNELILLRKRRTQFQNINLEESAIKINQCKLYMKSFNWIKWKSETDRQFQFSLSTI